MSPDGTGRSYGGESALDRDERRRRQLVDAGLRVFGTTGYRSATVRGLCREAKVADRHFYEYFESTEDLLLAVYGECMSGLMGATVKVMGALPPETDVETIARTALDGLFEVAENPKLARVVWLEVLGVSPRVEQTYLVGMRRFGELIAGYLPEVGEFTDIDADVLVTAAVGGISHTALTWYLGGYALERRIVVASMARFLIGIRSSLLDASLVAER